MEPVDVVILAAGLGSRLASERPKCLNVLPDGRSILTQQIDNIRLALGDAARILVVTGFQCWAVMEHAPGVTYAYNERFAQTNTNRSLLRALEVTGGRPLVWMNGDVVFDHRALMRVHDQVVAGQNAVAVDTSQVAEEEVKYTVRDGSVEQLSKEIPAGVALGEAVGINGLAEPARALVRERLRGCEDSDYFEKALEDAIRLDGLRVVPVDVTDLYAVEVDTFEDLERARAVYAAAHQADDARRVTGGDAAAAVAAPGAVPDNPAPLTTA